MASANAKKSKPTRTFALTPKSITLLDQLATDSGMQKSEIVNMLIIDYHASIMKKICP